MPAQLTLASPQGGQPSLDPKSDEPDAQTDATRRFRADPQAGALLANTVPLASVRADDFDAVFYPGGHGPLWDLAVDSDAIRLIETMIAAGKPVAAVCHAPGVLGRVKGPDGTPLVKGKRVTGFTNTGEAAVGLTDVVPFLVEDMLVQNGGQYSKAEDWQPYVITDGLLVTGQNPASSEAGAHALLAMLKARAQACEIRPHKAGGVGYNACWRAPAHCGMVYLVRSGTKQPKPFTASAADQARLFPFPRFSSPMSSCRVATRTASSTSPV